MLAADFRGQRMPTGTWADTSTHHCCNTQQPTPSSTHQVGKHVGHEGGQQEGGACTAMGNQ